ncbi:hypothetical protein BUALT_Bualt08G0071400 [Buddleja alternifolia]|uniref:ZF-HD dimerization-type domain-containing protein n=1 Tax=Buddleja alternifolia TaxID=168488 RepID=A0AAV6X3U0_9LAMI|nr:hypothetical protein BUALT_Bualt08G0071400 [Buddleja alternifolia]
MALSGEDKEIRMQGYNNPNSLENPIIEKPIRLLDPNSGGSKPKPGNPRINYRECLKNHAANIGGNVTDGCGEFMPSGDDGTLEALKCAACNCHRNFHRKEHPGEVSSMVHPLQLPPPLPSPSMSHHRVGGGAAHWTSMVQPVKMAFGGGGGGGGSVGTDSSSEELNFNAFHSNAVAPPPPQFVNKKRHRTKFTAEQKEKMLEFAEKLGWRIPREDDTEVQRFCAENGVKRQPLSSSGALARQACVPMHVGFDMWSDSTFGNVLVSWHELLWQHMTQGWCNQCGMVGPECGLSGTVEKTRQLAGWLDSVLGFSAARGISRQCAKFLGRLGKTLGSGLSYSTVGQENSAVCGQGRELARRASKAPGRPREAVTKWLPDMCETWATVVA